MLPPIRNCVLSLVLGILAGFSLYATLSELPESPVLRNHNNLTSISLALSLAKHPDEVYEILGGPEYEEFIETIDRLKNYSMYSILWIVLFLLFCIQMAIQAQKDSTQKWQTYLLISSFSFAGILGILETIQLQKVLDANSATKMEKSLHWMVYWSQGKWFLFFHSLALLSMRQWLQEKGLFMKACAISLFCSYLFYLFSFVRLNIMELGVLFSLFGCLFFWVYCLLKLLVSRKT